jgi:propionate catabolism operon transcriptional regulator
MAESIKLVFIGTYPQVSKSFMQITSKMKNIEAINIEASFDEAVKKARELEPHIDAILSRGGTADRIREAVGIPVISVPITNFDVVKALHILPKKLKNIALIYYHKNMINVEDIESLYNIKILEYHFSDYRDIEKSVMDCNERGIQAILGGEVASSIARKYGIQSVVINAGYDAVSRAVTEALQILEEKKKEQAKAAQYKAAFTSLVEGIVILDETQRIVLINRTAKLLFSKEYDIGQLADDIIIDKCCQQLYLDPHNASEINEIKRLNKEVYAVNYTPVRSQRIFLGVVIRYENVTKVQSLEQRIRKEFHTKGFVAKHCFDDIIGQSNAMQKVVSIARVYAGVDSSILIEGESGTGKEYFAQSIHNTSSRKCGPFVAVNCTAIPDNLLESELFGYEAGAFTGAKKEGKPGLFEMAHGGTLFLDEIGEITEHVQTRLLRVLQEKEIMRVGGDKIIPVDVRIMSATNSSLWKRTKDGEFRVDLYYRLNVFHLDIPPLRERGEDILLLSQWFAKKHGIKLNRIFHQNILPLLYQYSWPGNVRELESVIERYCLLSTLWNKQNISLQEMKSLLGIANTEALSKDPFLPLPSGNSLKEMVAAFERKVIKNTLEICGQNQLDAANRLGIAKTTLWRKLKENNSFIL